MNNFFNRLSRSTSVPQSGMRRRRNAWSLNDVGSLLESRTLLAATFGLSTHAMPTNSALGIVAADFNGDSNPDFAVSRGNGAVTVKYGNGSGGFASNVGYSTAIGYHFEFGIASGHFSGSPLPEIVVGGEGYVRILNNNGTSFSTGNAISMLGSTPITGVAVGDLNGDGYNDIAACLVNYNIIRVKYLNGSLGTIGTQDFTVGSRPMELKIGDLNNDGLKDLAVANSYSNSVTVLLNQGGGSLPSFASNSYLTNGNQPHGLELVDLSGDGLLDIAVANYSSQSVSYMRNTGAGAFTVNNVVSGFDTLVGITSLDFDRDGKVDIACTGSSSLRVFRNAGTTLSYDSGFGISSPYDIAAADFNKDGRSDLVTSGGGSNLSTVLLGTTNSVPSEIDLSMHTLAENSPVPTTVGVLGVTDVNTLDTQTLTLVSGTGSTDNSKFSIVGNSLRTAAVLDYETKNSYSIRVRTTDPYGGSFEKVFTISVTNVNETPIDISLSNSSLGENAGEEAVIGTLSASDPDADETVSFLLPSGVGDNSLFNISGTALQASSSFDFETRNTYSVTVRVTDAGGLTFDKAFAISVTNVNESPTNITLSGSSVAETLAVGTTIGSFSTVDPDGGNTFTYSLVSGTGDTDNASFTIGENALKTNAVFDFETKNSYSIRVRSEDQGGLSFENIFTITVIDVQEDVTPPESLIATLPSTSSSLTFPLSVSAYDPGGPAASGVAEIDFYYSTGGPFIKFATTPASNPSADFTGSANTTYWFRSIARDYAGNVEVKTTADTYTRIGDVLPPTTQVTSATHSSSGLFTINMTGTKASGAPMTAFDVYVVIDGNAPVLVGTAGAGAATGGVYSASLLYQGLTDGNSHTYRFYSIGKDSAGNTETTPVSGDVSVTASFSAGGLTLGAIDVQNGSNQRSYVRHLDLLFSSSTGLSDLANTGRVRVERFGIDATSVAPGTGALVSGFTVSQADNRLKLDFGSTGLGGLRQACNGFYRVLVDIDGNGNFTDAGDGAMEFHRLFGDADGNGVVDIADTNLVTAQIGRTGSNLDGDLDGNGAVNSTDRLFTVQQRGKKLLDPLLGWLDD